MKTRTFTAFIGLLLVVATMLIQSRMHIGDLRKPVGLAFKPPQLMLSQDLIQITAGEFSGLLSDYILLEIGSYIGSDAKANQNDYRSIYLALKLALALDPYFQQTYLLVQGILPWKAGMVDESLALLKVSKEHRPWDWLPGYYMGFNYYYFQNDFASASEVLLETAKIEGAPVLLAVLGARFAVKGQQTQAAIAMLMHMLKNPEATDADRREIEHRLTALNGILHLERAIEQYMALAKRYPSNLNDLITSGIIKSLPSNPYADRYFYDSNTGRVFFDEIETLTHSNN